jgi:RNA polymerase sigma-70 factor (ECF subfamily)
MYAPGPDPADLLRLSQAGDAEARGRLLELYRNYLTLLARAQIGRQLQGKVDASDLVQETFLAAHRDFAAFRGTTEAELVSWLRHILAARLGDQVRRFHGARCRDVRLEQRLADELAHSSQALEQGLAARQSSPSERAVRRERAVLLADALGQLPADYAEVLTLHYLEGLTFPEVAARLGRSLDSIKKVWVRALARLKRSLGGTL